MKRNRRKSTLVDQIERIELIFFRAPLFDGIQHLSPDIQNFLQLISCFQQQTIPLIIFTRSACSHSRWRSNGELNHDPQEATLVPPYIARLFEESTETAELSEDVLSTVDLELVRIKYKGGRKLLSMTERLKKEVRENISQGDLIVKRFDLLSIILRALPDEYSGITWEEVRTTLDETVQKSCLPLIRVINLEDIKKYVTINAQSRSVSPQYLASLVVD